MDSRSVFNPADENHQADVGTPPSAKTKAFSFDIRANKRAAGSRKATMPANQSEPRQRSPQSDSASSPAVVNPFPTGSLPGALPILPKLKRTEFSSHRHEANPALAMNILVDIQQMVETWQRSLRQVVVEIQNLYLDGPIIDGWLESYRPQQPPYEGANAAVLRHGDPAQIMAYVEDLQIAPEAEGPSTGQTAPQTGDELANATHYRICGLDDDGKLRCQPCPPAQLPVVSMAIARHQKLRQLLNQKQYLEARLKRAVEGLDTVRRDLQIDESAPL